MNRIEEKFFELKRQNKKALIAYITAGDPSLKVTGELISTLFSAGVDILEIGIPFSDPTADGPIIQRAAQRALKDGTTLEKVLHLLREKKDYGPFVLFGYYNPIFRYGKENFARLAKKVGVDGLLVVDLPPEEAGELRRYTDKRNIAFISLIAPTTTDERIRFIISKASGFLYYISVTGVTGTKRPVVEEIKRDMERIRKLTDLPVVIGFGITSAEQVKELSPFADGLVVGSALVRLIEEHAHSIRLHTVVADYIRNLKSAM